MIEHYTGDKIDYAFRIQGVWFDARLAMRNNSFAFDVYARRKHTKEWRSIGVIAGMESLAKSNLKPTVRRMVETSYAMSSL